MYESKNSMFLQNTQKSKREITLNLTSCCCKKDNCGLTTILTNGCHIIYTVTAPHNRYSATL